MDDLSDKVGAVILSMIVGAVVYFGISISYHLYIGDHEVNYLCEEMNEDCDYTSLQGCGLSFTNVTTEVECNIWGSCEMVRENRTRHMSCLEYSLRQEGLLHG